MTVIMPEASPMQHWRHVWREGIAPLLPQRQLEALRQGLAEDDPRLIQGCTTDPPPLQCCADWPVKGACALAYCGWIGGGLESVMDVEQCFGELVRDITTRIVSVSLYSSFLTWFDETPRDEMRSALLPEVERSIQLLRETEGPSARASDVEDCGSNDPSNCPSSSAGVGEAPAKSTVVPTPENAL